MRVLFIVSVSSLIFWSVWPGILTDSGSLLEQGVFILVRVWGKATSRAQRTCDIIGRCGASERVGKFG